MNSSYIKSCWAVIFAVVCPVVPFNTFPASKTATFNPSLTNRYADVIPVIPPPTMTTSTLNLPLNLETQENQYQSSNRTQYALVTFHFHYFGSQKILHFNTLIILGFPFIIGLYEVPDKCDIPVDAIDLIPQRVIMKDTNF